MAGNNNLAEKHNLVSEATFRLKTSILIGRRQLNNLFGNLKKHPKSNLLQDHPIIAVSESQLWNDHDTAENWILTAGKIQNLRLSVGLINNLEIPANTTFSFWKHLGNPTRSKGYVAGREIREGCIIPSVAGGLCQLSNALYDAALKANFEIIERHRHTRVIKGSLAEKDRDATIKWNYIDLKFRSPQAFRMEAELSADKLIIKFKGSLTNAGHSIQHPDFKLANKLNDCYSCGNADCFKYPGTSVIKREQAVTAFILDEKWPEYDEYVQQLAKPDDLFIIPIKRNFLLR